MLPRYLKHYDYTIICHFHKHTTYDDDCTDISEAKLHFLLV